MSVASATGADVAGPSAVLAAGDLGHLVDLLWASGWRVVGPTVRDGAVVLDEVTDVADLPWGWEDTQGPGSYRLRQGDGDAVFAHVVGPMAPKREFLAPRRREWSIDLATGAVEQPEPSATPVALLGVRGCDLAAIAVQDRVLAHGAVPDPAYVAAREDTLVVAVDCARPAATCFCTSMGGDPGVDDDGADLRLTELLDGEHRFLVHAGTDRGRALLDRLPTRPAPREDLAGRDRQLEGARAAIQRQLPSEEVHDLLLGNLEHAQWDDVAGRCLACGNCTLVCPTCFCTEVEDVTDLDGTTSHQDRRWASCFESAFSHLPDGSVRASTRARYRQWATHKLATWIDQFDESGCVGCGRCITWCPVGIDITAEVDAIRQTDERVQARGAP